MEPTSTPTPINAFASTYPYHDVRLDVSTVYNEIIQEVRIHIKTNLESKIDISIVQRNIIEISNIRDSTITLEDINQTLDFDGDMSIVSKALMSVDEEQGAKIKAELKKKIKTITSGIFSRSKKSTTLQRVYNKYKQLVESIVETNIYNTIMAASTQINSLIIDHVSGSTIELKHINQSISAKITASIASLAKTDVQIKQEIDAEVKEIFDYSEEEGGVFGLFQKLLGLVKGFFKLIGTILKSIGDVLNIVPNTLGAISTITREITSNSKFLFATSATIFAFMAIVKLISKI